MKHFINRLKTRLFFWRNPEVLLSLQKGFAGGVGILLGIGIGTVALYAVSVTLNTFTSGTPINAAKVNENFANLKTAVESINEVPVGTIIAFGGVNPPTGWFICDGTPVSRTTYSALYAVISINFGVGDGSTTFHLPDLRHRFLRGWDNLSTSTRDLDAGTRMSMNTGGNSGTQLGSVQDDQLISHSHNYTTTGWQNSRPCNSGCGNFVDSNAAVTSSYGGTETRPKNAYVNFIIKY